MPLDHSGISVPAAKLEAFVTWLTAAFAPLGFSELMRIPLLDGGVTVGLGEYSGTGTGQADAYWWVSPCPAELETAAESLLQLGHTCFSAASAQQVRDFHAAALKAGAKDDGAPGLRPPPYYLPDYYAAFVRDPVLNMKIEVICRKGDV